jgi:hypothetical protein
LSQQDKDAAYHPFMRCLVATPVTAHSVLSRGA